MPPKKLICDRCGEIIEDKDEVELALDGTDAWHAYLRERGQEPRGWFPCKNYIRCQGEMIDWKDRDKIQGGKTDSDQK